MSLLEPTRKPVAALRARYGLSLALAELGHHVEADKALGRALALLDQLEPGLHPPGFRWLQALVLERGGRAAEAAEVLGELLRDLDAASATYDALLVRLELARSHAFHGEVDAARELLQSVGAAAKGAPLGADARAAVSFVARYALAGQGERRVLLPDLIAYLLRTRLRRDLRFSTGQAPQAEVAWDDLELSVQSDLCRAAGLSSALAHPTAELDAYTRELLRLTAEETVLLGLSFEPEDEE